MQAALKKSINLNLTLKMEIFIKEYVSLIRLLFSVFTEAIGRIWQPYHP
jgi:hypothetical protein